MGVLEQLMRRVGHVVPKDVLEDRIYGFDEEIPCELAWLR